MEDLISFHIADGVKFVFDPEAPAWTGAHHTTPQYFRRGVG